MRERIPERCHSKRIVCRIRDIVNSNCLHAHALHTTARDVIRERYRNSGATVGIKKGFLSGSYRVAPIVK